MALVLLMLAALACTCGPTSDADLSATASALSGAATAFSQQSTSVAAALTNAPTYNAQATVLAQTASVPTATRAAATALPTEAQATPFESHQWAESAIASSEWSTESGAARQAAGAPDSAECIDQHTAWASVGRNEVATLTLDYSTPVVPTQLNIYQTWHPDAVSQVEVIDVDGISHTVYTATPTQLPDGSTPCPYILTIDISDITTPIAQVVVTIDQTTFDNWNEIDAVELVGIQ